MSKIDWFIGFTSENFKKITAKIFKKGLMKQYVGLVMIVKELTLFRIYHLFF